MKSFTQCRKAAASSTPISRTVTAVAFAAVFAAGCDRASEPTAPAMGGEAVVFRPQFVSETQGTPVTAVPQSRSYPGTKVRGEASVCKDASSPAGTYTFNVSATNLQTGDLLAPSVTLSPGQCSIVYNRVNRPGLSSSPVTHITITEVIPAGASYRLDRLLADDDASGARTIPGPSVTLIVNEYHGGYANFFNVVNLGVVNLGAAAHYGILAGTAITCVTGGFVTGSVGISPKNSLTGFPPCEVTGSKDLGNAVAAQAQSDLTRAYNALFALPCNNDIVANLGGHTLPAGVYCSGSSIGITGTLTLDGRGDPDAMFVFKAGSSLTTAGNIVLINGAQAKNVFFQVGSSATLGTSSHIQGNILAKESISLDGSVFLFGRALAQDGAVTLGGTGNHITVP